MKARQPGGRAVPLLISIAAAAALGACGGGGDVPLPDDAYETWIGNSNGVIVKDASNDNFAVRKDTGQIARYSDDLLLANLYVFSGTVFRSGAPIGVITSTLATNGSTIAVLRCSNGLNMDITVTGSGASASWSHRC